jgi:hypothetical protein
MAAGEQCPIKFTLDVQDSFHRSYSVNPVHLPQIRNSCEGKEPCQLAVNSVTQALYNWLEFFDTGFFPIAAFSLRTKLNSRQKFWQYAGVPNPNFKETDGADIGSEINQQVYQWALDNAGEKARDYFQQVGTPIGMGKDIAPIVAAGPLWIWNYPKYQYFFLNGKTFYFVKSTVLKTPTNYFIPSARGYHYCQLLSPAAAMEWIYVDGLRLNASVSGNTVVYGPLGGTISAFRFVLRGVLRQTRTRGLLKRV